MKRFIEAHESYFHIALIEIQKVRKEYHWMWFIFPQLKGLSNSYYAYFYGLDSSKETEEFYNNDYLKNNLITITKELLKLKTNDPEEVFEYPDNLKLKSSMTLFYIVTRNNLFKEVLDKFFFGELDINIVNLLK